MSTQTTKPAAPAALGDKPRLKRQLGFGALLVYGLLFFTPLAPVAVFGLVVNRSGGVPVLVYLVAAVVMGLSSVSYREMALRFPTCGSVYGYVRLATNPRLGFLAGWLILLDYLLMPSLLVILAALALGHSFPGVPAPVFAAGFVAASVLLNIFGIAVTTRAGIVLLAIQGTVLAAFTGFVAIAVERGVVHLSTAPLWRPGTTPGGVFAAVSLAALSYLGFDAVATLNEEARGGGRAIASATNLLLVVITALFATQVWLAALVHPTASYPAGAATTRAFYAAVDAVTPPWFGVVFTVTNAFVAIFACLVVAHSSTARLLYAMGRDRVLPAWLGHATPNGVPRNAVLATGATTLIVAVTLSTQAELATTLVTFGALSSYIVLHVAVIMRCFHREHSRRLLTHLIVPVLGIATLSVALLQTQPLTRTVGLGWLALGMLGYAVTGPIQRRRHAIEPQPHSVAEG